MGAAHPGEKRIHKRTITQKHLHEDSASTSKSDSKPSLISTERKEAKKLHCINCDLQFDPSLNTSSSCRHHSGRKEMIKDSLQWNCCHLPDLESAASYNIQVAVVGSKGVGKSSLITRISLDEWLDDIRQPGSNDTSMSSLYTFTKKGVSYNFEFNEIPEPPAKLDDSLLVEHVVAFTDAHIVLFVFDVSNLESYSKLSDYDEKIKRAKDGSYPSILVGNKTDVPEHEKKK